MTSRPLGLVVEGASGASAVYVLLRNANLNLGSPLNFPGQPTDCSTARLVDLAILPRVRAAILKKFCKVIVVLDRENRNKCPGELAQEVRTQLVVRLRDGFNYRGNPPVEVVVADKMMENWLIADPQGISNHAHITQNLSGAVRNRADGLNAIQILKRAYSTGHQYHKTRDAPKLAKHVRVLNPEVRRRSRSLDKLLRVAGVATPRRHQVSAKRQ